MSPVAGFGFSCAATRWQAEVACVHQVVASQPARQTGSAMGYGCVRSPEMRGHSVALYALHRVHGRQGRNMGCGCVEAIGWLVARSARRTIDRRVSHCLHGRQGMNTSCGCVPRPARQAGNAYELWVCPTACTADRE